MRTIPLIQINTSKFHKKETERKELNKTVIQYNNKEVKHTKITLQK